MRWWISFQNVVSVLAEEVESVDQLEIEGTQSTCAICLTFNIGRVFKRRSWKSFPEIFHIFIQKEL